MVLPRARPESEVAAHRAGGGPAGADGDWGRSGDQGDVAVAGVREAVGEAGGWGGEGVEFWSAVAAFDAAFAVGFGGGDFKRYGCIVFMFRAVGVGVVVDECVVWLG